MFKDSLLKKKEEKYTALIRSPVFYELTQLVDNRSKIRVLDLGTAHAGSVSFFNQYNCYYHVIDVYHILSECKKAEHENHEQFQNRLFRLFEDLVPLREDAKLDLILSWDGFNYLNRQTLELFSLYLSKFSNSETYLHSFIYGHQVIPERWARFDILSDEHVLAEYENEQTCQGPIFNQTDIKQLIARFSVKKSILLKSGIQEYLLQHRPYS